MKVYDLLILGLGSALTMIYFVHRTNLEKSKVRVRVRKK